MASLGRNNLKYARQAAATIIVALATLEATFLIQYFASRKAIAEEATNEAESQLEASNLRISVVLDQVEAAVRNNVWPVRKTLAAPDSLWSLVRRIVDCNPSVYGSAIALMENYIPEKGRFFSPYAYRNGDRIDTIQLGKESYGYPEKEWFVKPLEIDAGYWSEPYFDTGGGEMLMTTFSLPVTDVQGEVAAVLTADISLDWLTDVVGSLEMYPEAFSALISRTGQLMVCPAPAFVLKKTIQEVAAVFVAASPKAHFGIAKKVMEAGKSLFIEKPPCSSLEELQEQESIWGKRSPKAVFAVGLQKRYAPATKMLRKRLAKETPISYTMRYCTGAYPEGDALLDLFIHPLDLAVSLFGKPQVVGCDRTGETIRLLLKHQDGVGGMLELSTDYSWKAAEERLTVVTGKGVYDLRQMERLTYTAKQRSFMGMPLEKVVPMHPAMQVLYDRNNFVPTMANNQVVSQGFYDEINAFVEAVEGRKNGVLTDPSQLLDTFELIEELGR